MPNKVAVVGSIPEPGGETLRALAEYWETDPSDIRFFSAGEEPTVTARFLVAQNGDKLDGTDTLLVVSYTVTEAAVGQYLNLRRVGVKVLRVQDAKLDDLSEEALDMWMSTGRVRTSEVARRGPRKVQLYSVPNGASGSTSSGPRVPRRPGTPMQPTATVRGTDSAGFVMDGPMEVDDEVVPAQAAPPRRPRAVASGASTRADEPPLPPMSGASSGRTNGHSGPEGGFRRPVTVTQNGHVPITPTALSEPAHPSRDPGVGNSPLELDRVDDTPLPPLVAPTRRPPRGAEGRPASAFVSSPETTGPVVGMGVNGLPRVIANDDGRRMASATTARPDISDHPEEVMVPVQGYSTSSPDGYLTPPPGQLLRDPYTLNPNPAPSAPYAARLGGAGTQEQELAERQMSSFGSPSRQYRGASSTEVVYVTGASGGTGKTTVSWIAANTLSLALQRDGITEPVWLIEVDYRNPKLEQRLRSTGKNLGEIAAYIKHMSKRKERLDPNQMIDMVRRNTIRREDTGLNILVAPYDLGADINYLTYAIQAVLKIIAGQGRSHVFLDAGTLTAAAYDPLDQLLAGRVASQVLVVGDPGRLEDCKRTLHVLTRDAAFDGRSASTVKVFLNRTTQDLYMRTAAELVPHRVVGAFPRIPEIDGSWIGSAPEQAISATVTRMGRCLVNMGYGELAERFSNRGPATPVSKGGLLARIGRRLASQ